PPFEYESRLVLSPTHDLGEQTFIHAKDLVAETLIAYPVEAKRLDIIANFMTPAQVSFKSMRTTELTAMLMQLVASERGVAALPDWVVAEYEKKGWVVSRPLGSGVYWQLYAATRTSSQDTAYMQGFASLLEGIVKPV